MAEGMMGSQERDMARMYQQVSAAVNQYHGNPGVFTEAQVKQLKSAADAMGIAMSVGFSPGRAFKKGLYELGEGLTFGALPNRWDPGAMNTGEDIAGGVGGLLGLAMPVGGGLALGSKAMRGAARIAGGGKFIPAGGRLLKTIAGIKNQKLRKQMINAVLAANRVAKAPAATRALSYMANSPRLMRYGGAGLGLLNRDILGESNPEDVMEMQ